MNSGLPVFQPPFRKMLYTRWWPSRWPFSSYPKRKVGHHQNLPLSSGHVFVIPKRWRIVRVVEISGDLTEGPKNQPSWNPLLQWQWVRTNILNVLLWHMVSDTIVEHLLSLQHARVPTAAVFSIISYSCKRWEKTPKQNMQLNHWIL